MELRGKRSQFTSTRDNTFLGDRLTHDRYPRNRAVICCPPSPITPLEYGKTEHAQIWHDNANSGMRDVSLGQLSSDVTGASNSSCQEVLPSNNRQEEKKRSSTGHRIRKKHKGRGYGACQPQTEVFEDYHPYADSISTTNSLTSSSKDSLYSASGQKIPYPLS